MKKITSLFLSLILTLSILYYPVEVVLADEVVATVTTGSGPRGLAALGTKIYVAIYDESEVDIIDTENNNSITTATVGGAPDFNVALGTKVYVVNTGDGTVSVINTANNNSVSTVTVGSTPLAQIVLGSKIYVLNSGDNTVSVINTANNNSVETVNVGFSAVAMTSLGTKVYVAEGDGNVSIIDTANNNSVTSLGVGTGVTPSSITSLGTKVFVANTGTTVTQIDTSSGNATTSITVGMSGSPGPIVIASSTKVYVSNNSADTVSIIDTANNNSVSTVNVGDRPQAIIANGSKIYVANIGANTVSIIDTANGNSVSSVPVGATPYSMVGLGTKVYVANESGLSVTVIEGETTAPTVSTFSPADNAVDVAIDANLIVTFDEDVDAETGNITIFKSSDDSVVEAIAVGSGQVTGSGASAITINPSASLEYATEYYVQIAATAFDDSVGNSYAGISDTTTWSFTTVDEPTSSQESSGGSSGTSFRGRVKNLESQGKGWQAMDLLMDRIANLQAQLGISDSKNLSFVRDLTVGMEGEDVRLLQKILIDQNVGQKALELARIGATGYFVNYTRDALAEYQAKYAIIPSVGYFGSITRTQMKYLGIQGLWW